MLFIYVKIIDTASNVNYMLLSLYKPDKYFRTVGHTIYV